MDSDPRGCPTDEIWRAEAEAEDARSWFRDDGWDVRVFERDMRETFRDERHLDAPSFNHTHWADLIWLRNKAFVIESYGSGMSRDEAIMRARQRYGTKQT